jgi:hypothetical protein
MPNYSIGKDNVPKSWDSTSAEETYNGLLRINTGVVDGDGTGDPFRFGTHKLLANMDITITEENVSIPSSPNKVVKRDANGDIFCRKVIATTTTASLEDLGITSGTIDGGSW